MFAFLYSDRPGISAGLMAAPFIAALLWLMIHLDVNGFVWPEPGTFNCVWFGVKQTLQLFAILLPIIYVLGLYELVREVKYRGWRSALVLASIPALAMLIGSPVFVMFFAVAYSMNDV